MISIDQIDRVGDGDQSFSADEFDVAMAGMSQAIENMALTKTELYWGVGAQTSPKLISEITRHTPNPWNGNGHRSRQADRQHPGQLPLPARIKSNWQAPIDTHWEVEDSRAIELTDLSAPKSPAEAKHRIRAAFSKAHTGLHNLAWRASLAIGNTTEHINRHRRPYIGGVLGAVAVGILVGVATSKGHNVEAFLPRPSAGGGHELLTGKSHTINQLALDNRPSPQAISQAVSQPHAPIYGDRINIVPGGGGATAVQEYAARHGEVIDKAQGFRLFSKLRVIIGDNHIVKGIRTYYANSDLRFGIGNGRWYSKAQATLNNLLGL